MRSISRDMFKYLGENLEKLEKYKEKKLNYDIDYREAACINIQIDMLEEFKKGYILMAEINLGMSEIGFEEDIEDLKKYEESIMGSGVK